jgi:hypothetical protein
MGPFHDFQQLFASDYYWNSVGAIPVYFSSRSSLDHIHDVLDAQKGRHTVPQEHYDLSASCLMRRSSLLKALLGVMFVCGTNRPVVGDVLCVLNQSSMALRCA